MTEKIKEQILAVRATGRTNMFDTNMVQVIADEMKFYELVVFIEEHKGDYAKIYTDRRVLIYTISDLIVWYIYRQIRLDISDF